MQKIFLLTVIVIFFIPGCGSGSDNEFPPEITLGQDACNNCFMLINEKRFAASVWLENGEAKRFDDIGCMLEFIKKNDDRIKSYWVYDYKTKGPVKAETAFFINSKNIITPMGFGIAAFNSEETAHKFAKQNNTKVVSFKELKTINLISKME